MFAFFYTFLHDIWCILQKGHLFSNRSVSSEVCLNYENINIARPLQIPNYLHLMNVSNLLKSQSHQKC